MICNGDINEILLSDHINLCTFSMWSACDPRCLEIMEQDFVSLFGWMTAINLGLFFIGLLKVTLLKDITLSVTRALFGNHLDSMMDAAPRILMQYYILILLFNLVPYFVLRLTNWRNRKSCCIHDAIESRQKYQQWLKATTSPEGTASATGLMLIIDGLYVIWEDRKLVYCGKSGREIEKYKYSSSKKKYGLINRLNSHATGRLRVDQFCVYVANELLSHYLIQKCLSNSEMGSWT